MGSANRYSEMSTYVLIFDLMTKYIVNIIIIMCVSEIPSVLNKKCVYVNKQFSD